MQTLNTHQRMARHHEENNHPRAPTFGIEAFIMHQAQAPRGAGPVRTGQAMDQHTRIVGECTIDEGKQGSDKGRHSFCQFVHFRRLFVNPVAYIKPAKTSLPYITT
jgi:hypothetical protein